MDRYTKKKAPDDMTKKNLKAEAMQEVLPGYEEYLVLLQERNRLLKRLRKKSKKQIDIERKEQGFSIYVNGANTEMLAKKQKSPIHKGVTPREDRPSSGRLKTAGEVGNKRILNMEDLTAISNYEKEKIAERNRAKTAPARERRRIWMAESVEIKTERGENRRVKAPEMITGNYEDDFEDEDDDDDDDDEDDDDRNKMRASMSQYLSDDDSDSDIEIDASRHNRFNKFKKSPPKTKTSSTEVVKKKPNPVDEEINEKLELSISDVKKLRQSLCMNANIRESLAKEVSSEEELSDRESPIPEEDEDIVEDLVPASDSVEENKKAPMFKPTDTIVLELSVPKQQRKVEHNLSAARKKDIDDSNGYKPHHRDPHPVNTRGQQSKPDSVLQANVPSRSKQERPLSAHRVNRPEKVDSNEEASAVMAALKAENEKTSKLARNPPPSPDRSKQRPSNLHPQRRSVEARRVKTPTNRSDVRQSQNRSKDGPPLRNSADVRESSQGRESKNIPQSPRQDSDESFLKNDKLSEIMKKVLLMQPKQQKKLMTVLSKIETSVDSEAKQKPNTPVKATEPVNNMVNRQSRNKNVSPVKSRSPPDMTEVNIELVSTWGHKELIGLTELQFFDKNRKPIPVSSSNVAVHGARENRNLVDVIFNGKGKTNKDRNMWCCKYRKGIPIELCILLPVSSSDLLSRVKIWNYNKSIQDLDIGVKHARIFVGGELVFDGDVDKGCGNQVFDYGFIINLNDMESQLSPRSPKPTSPARVSPPPKPTSPARVSPPPKPTSPARVSPSQSKPTDLLSEQKMSPLNVPKPKSTARQSRTERNAKLSSQSKVSQHNVKKSPVRSPVLQSRSDEASSKPKLFKRNISKSPSPARPASGSSNSSIELVQKSSKPPVRSETRTMDHSDRTLPKPNVSDRHSPDSEEMHKDEGKLPGRHKGSRTPRKSKRMAAKLDGHSSTETDPKHLSDSADARSPRQQKEEVVSSQPVLPPEPSWEPPSEPIIDPPSQHSTLSQSEDDIPMIQKLQQLNQKQQDQNKKKDKPSWLKNEDFPGPFENPPSSRQEQRTPVNQPPVNQIPVKNDDHMVQTQQDDIDMLIDEELAMWPKAGKSSLKTVFDSEKEKTEPSKEDGKSTPMQKIKENRSKWRGNQKKNLEESWGSLNMFDRQQKGRISMDLDDDSLDEYLNPPKKQVPKEATIPEEEDIVDAILNEVPGDDNFIIPELPYGKNIVIDILSTWGDRHYVGLTGIQVFSSTGEAVNIAKISAEPLDINVLPEYNKDPRVVTNVLDGVNRTRDDVHMWLAPFTTGQHNYLYLTFDKPCKIALMRIWNYNKSRIHSYRGAKDVIITLDQTEIFKGEIERACGGTEGGTEAFGDTILFTTDENILEAVSRNDDAYEGEMFDSDEPDDVPFERPRTADAGDDEHRPFTRAVGNIKDGSTSPLPPRPATSMVTEGDVVVFKGKKLVLNFTATWGDMHYLGVTGIEVVGRDGEALPVTLDILSANPPDLHTLPGHEQDDRTLDKIIDNTNVTLSDEHMWMIPFTEGQNHTLTVDFPQTQLISGLRVWNYNKSREDTYRGARIVHVTIDSKQVSPPEGYLIRKGPGVCHFDFAQEISFGPQPKAPQPTAVKAEPMQMRKSFSADEASQEYENVQMPCGFIYQLQLITTWGDPYYVGLNGLQFYDAQHNRIELTESNIAAYPDSVNVLDGTSNDVRTPDKLIDDVNDTVDGTHMWVAPILPGILNRVYVIFDQPTTVSMIKLWNYSKTPSRGSKDFALLVDDLLVYNGMLQAVMQGARGIIPTCNAPQKYHTILFTDNKEILRKEKHTVISNQTGDQDIQLTNDKKVVSHYTDPKKAESGKPVNQELRPKTSLVVTKKRR